MTTAEVLQKARDLIADESRWTSQALARDRFRHAVMPEDPAACKFCAVGAIYATAHSLAMGPEGPGTTAAYDALKAAVPHRFADHHGRPLLTPSGVNDSHGHGAVLHLYDLAIAEASA
jgi:hypothetical protein